jgi:hypothetical protein
VAGRFAAVVEQVPGVVGDQPPPGARLVSGEAAGQGGGDGSVPVEVRGVIVAAEQRRERDGDVDRGPLPVGFWQTRVPEHPGEHVHERVGAALIRAAGIGASDQVPPSLPF